MRGIDPLAPRMRSECSTIWATSPITYLFIFDFSFISFFFTWLLFIIYMLSLEKMHPVGFEPTHLAIAVLETAPLDHSGTNAFYYYYFIVYPNLFFRPTYLLYIHTYIHITHYIYISYFLLYSLKILWRWGVSIPLPFTCEANALPFELHPPLPLLYLTVSLILFL